MLIEEPNIDFDTELASMTNDDIIQKNMLLDSEISIMTSNTHAMNMKIRKYKQEAEENKSKIKANKLLPYLVSNVIEV